MRAVEEILKGIQMINDVLSVKPRTRDICFYRNGRKYYQVLPSVLLHFVPGGVKLVRHVTGWSLVVTVWRETGPGLERIFPRAGGQSGLTTPRAHHAVHVGAQL